MGTVSQLGYAAARDLHACMHANQANNKVIRVCIETAPLPR
jgi:hypothetical protein